MPCRAVESAGPFEHGVDVDVRFVASCLKRIEGQALHYNAFAFGEVRGTEDTASDVCTLFKTRAFLVNLGALYTVLNIESSRFYLNLSHLNPSCGIIFQIQENLSLLRGQRI